jgi:hypothetical protein
MISNSDIQQGAVTQTKLSKNLRLPLNNIKAGTEGQVLVGQANGDLAYKDVSGAIGIDADGVATMATTTDSIPEGNTNLYYTDARVDARIKAVRTNSDQLATPEEPGFMPAEDKQKVDSTGFGGSEIKTFYVKWDNTAESTPVGMVSFSGTDVTLTHNFGTPFIITSVLDVTGHLGVVNGYADVNASSDVVVIKVSDNETKLSFNSEPDADDDFKVTILGGTE